MAERRPPHRSGFHPPRTHAVLAGLCGLLLLGVLAGCAHPQPAAGAATTAAALDTAADDGARSKLHAAVQASQPGSPDLAGARRMLASLLADESTEARAWHPYARALLEQIRERQRLAALGERLEREHETYRRDLEAREQALAELRRQHDALQRKLDALAEIEHRLAPPPAAPGADAPASEAGRR